METLPYKEIKTPEYIYREFNQDIDPEELTWHRDKRDREVEIIGETDWKFQFDNELPFILDKKIFIEKERYHRLIKGTTTLNLRITEY